MVSNYFKIQDFPEEILNFIVKAKLKKQKIPSPSIESDIISNFG